MHNMINMQYILKSNPSSMYDGGDGCVNFITKNLLSDVNDLTTRTCFQILLRKEYEGITSTLLTNTNENVTKIKVIVVNLESLLNSLIYHVKKRMNSYTHGKLNENSPMYSTSDKSQSRFLQICMMVVIAVVLLSLKAMMMKSMF